MRQTSRSVFYSAGYYKANLNGSGCRVIGDDWILVNLRMTILQKELLIMINGQVKFCSDTIYYTWPGLKLWPQESEKGMRILLLCICRYRGETVICGVTWLNKLLNKYLGTRLKKYLFDITLNGFTLNEFNCFTVVTRHQRS